MNRFSAASAAERIDAVLDEDSFVALPGSGAAIIGRGLVDDVPVWIAVTDPSRARGAIGIAAAQDLSALLQAARREARPLLLLLDSAGAKVDEGLGGLGAFRRLYHDALAARLAGVPMLALLGRSCFGGASMLACLCHARVYTSTLLAVSGPAVIEALNGKIELDAADKEQVNALMGGAARTKLGRDELSCDDEGEAVRFAASAWLRVNGTGAAEASTRSRHELLRQRLRAAFMDIDPSASPELRRVESLLPPGYSPVAQGDVVIARPAAGSGKPVFLGLLGGRAVGAYMCWQMSDALLEMARVHPTSAIVLLLDASGHAATRADEAVMLSAYLAHLSLVAAECAAAGQHVRLWIPGAAAGAVYVAFAAPAERVSALRSARIRILPEAAVRSIVDAPAVEDVDADAMQRAGVIDAVLDSRLETYAQVQP